MRIVHMCTAGDVNIRRIQADVSESDESDTVESRGCENEEFVGVALELEVVEELRGMKRYGCTAALSRAPRPP